MSLRGCWILSSTRAKPCQVVFSRIFSTVENRSKLIEENNYIALPNHEDLAVAVSEALGFFTDKELPKSCSKKEQKPVYTVKIKSGELWPFLIVEQNGYLFCCLPHVQLGSYNKPPLIEITGISMGFNLLLGMAEYLGKIPLNADQDWNKFSDLYLYLGQAAPFGTPVDVNPTTIRAMLMAKSGSSQTSHKVPAWKPLQYKGKSQLYFTIREYIKAVQFDKEESEDQCEVYGTVICRADLEGAVPDLTVTLCHTADGTSAPLQQIIYHPFVLSVEDQGEFVKSEDKKKERRIIRVTPPLDQFTLCHYNVDGSRTLPINGYYQMKGEEKVEILLQLKLSSGVKNSFEYCEAQLPFFNRGPIKHFDAIPSHGNVSIAPDKSTLVWDIGQKFPGKTLEVQLKATLKFARYNDSLADTTEKQFCVGKNSYVQLHFKMVDYTLSGLQVDSRALQVSPATKYKLTSVREFYASEFKIWNTHGDAPAMFQPPSQLLQEIQLANQQR